MNCLSVFDHFVGLALKGPKTVLIESETHFDTHRMSHTHILSKIFFNDKMNARLFYFHVTK